MQTECERILSKGIFTADYLQSEVLCEFFVDEQRKKLWMIEIDMLLELDRICKKHGLRYYLAYGSLLGAIRHHGFIPWDDDLDVAMPRRDFNRLVEVSNEFKDPYFFQTPMTDPGSAFSMGRIRNSNTTAMIRAFQYEKFNQGIVLDVLPIDKCKIETQQKRYNEVKKLTLNGSAYMRRNNKQLTDHDREIMIGAEDIDPIINYQKLQELCAEYENESTDYVCTMAITTYPWQKETFRAEDFRETVILPFEGFEFPAPAGYDKILKVSYGDYMKYPPVEERGSWHTRTTFYDPDRTYRHYIIRD